MDWQQLRREVFRQQEGRCADCGRRVALELHHTHYRDDTYGHKLGIPPDEDEVVGVCRACHHNRHVDRNGDFWRDPEAMEHYWRGFHEALERD